MKAVDLEGTPRPHFVRAGEINISTNRSLFNGEVVFSPSDDLSLADRDHVNVTHQMFAIWNVAHLVIKDGLLYPKIRVLSQNGNYFAETPLDTKVDLSVHLNIIDNNQKRLKGVISATFVEKAGKVLSVHQVVFVSTK